MLRIRIMTSADIDFGLQVKAEAGWNQTRQDWQRFLALRPHGCFVALWDDQPVGTVTTCVFQTVAWIGMMLVTTEYRRRGIGRALMIQALDSLALENVKSVRLDATPMGRPLYQTLDFYDQFELTRYGGQPEALVTKSDVEPLLTADIEGIRTLDQSAIGADRGALLAGLIDEHPSAGRAVRSLDSLGGYVLSRPGAKATQIGPCIAQSEESGRALLTDALVRFAGQDVFVDVPIDNRAAVALVESCGLRPLRQLTRMCRGEDNREHLPWLWASSGPEKG